MEFADRWLFAGGALLLASILAGKLSSRIGAPLLLVFLAIGVLVGEDGPGRFAFGETGGGLFIFRDVRTAYLIGSAALSLILFDGGIRTERASLSLALAPALVLATLGVAVTALLTGIVAAFALGRGWLEGLLIGSTVASTDAAAVFLLLHQRGTRLGERVNATLEVESGINDPVAVFLTMTLVALLTRSGDATALATLRSLAQEFLLGAAAGLAGGWLLVQLVNRLELAGGLYPILALAGALVLFAGTQLLEGSGFLAVYLAGIVLGNARLRAGRTIGRFVDGMAWLAQIVLFVMLGLFVSPASLLPDAPAALAIALALMLVARPLAVWLSLAPFRFTREERAFIAWVGLRGAVPIFLAMVPLLSGVPGSAVYFDVAFVVVLASLVLQGWTVVPAMRWLGLELPAAAAPDGRLDFDLAAGEGREVAVWRVAPGAAATARDFAELALPRRTRVIAVLRDGSLVRRAELARLQPRDIVLALVPLEQFETLDRLFAAGAAGRRAPEPLGDFALDPTTRVGEIADLYGLPAPVGDRERTLGELMHGRLKRRPSVGDRLHLGLADLVVRRMAGDRIGEIGLALDPRPGPLDRLDLVAMLRRTAQRLSAAARALATALRRRGKRPRSDRGRGR